MGKRATDLIRLPSSCSTATAGETLAALLERQQKDVSVAIDASGVTNIGQAVLQILVAARIDFQKRRRGFSILDPSAAFLTAARTGRFDRHLNLVRE
jgi:anti-anti-sigma regulatory factor